MVHTSSEQTLLPVGTSSGCHQSCLRRSGKLVSYVINPDNGRVFSGLAVAIWERKRPGQADISKVESLASCCRYSMGVSPPSES
jgi:hypothetical protein